MRSIPTLLLAFAVVLPPGAALAAGVEGGFSVGARKIEPRHAVALRIRDQNAPRSFETYVVLSENPVDAAAAAASGDPYTTIINDPGLRTGGAIRISLGDDGGNSTNAQFDWNGTQYVESSRLGGLTVKLERNDAEVVAGRVSYPQPVEVDGEPTRLDVRFEAPVFAPPRGTPLPRDGGPAGKAFLAFAKAVDGGDFDAAFALLSPDKAPQFAKEDYETAEENAASGLDILRAWGLRNSRVAGGESFPDHVVLEVEGELFEGMNALDLVRMVPVDGGWRYDGSARAGILRD
jgi:hypothetical protein